ncbi:MAG: hypothetical protein LUQ45_04085 [Methanoregulaceae archaeon]|nr:hypothetical protein [Methanoregulaceae archaeon]
MTEKAVHRLLIHTSGLSSRQDDISADTWLYDLNTNSWEQVGPYYGRKRP